MDSSTGGYASIAVGFLLLLIFGIRTGGENKSGWMFGLGTTVCLLGILWLLYQGSNQSTLIALIAICVGTPLFCSIFFGWPPLPFSRRLIKSHDEDVTVASFSANMELEALRGRLGKVVSPLRPSGIADFDGKRVDVITPGMMVEIGSYVRCIDVRAGRVVVSPVEKPSANDLEVADFS